MREEDSVKCNGTGTFQCGICYCPQGRYGEQCQCDGFTKLSDKECKPNNTTETVCSGMGNCVCGKCVCHRQVCLCALLTGATFLLLFQFLTQRWPNINTFSSIAKSQVLELWTRQRVFFWQRTLTHYLHHCKNSHSLSCSPSSVSLHFFTGHTNKYCEW